MPAGFRERFGLPALVRRSKLNAFEKENFVTSENEVIIATVPDEPNGLNTILKSLDSEKNNITGLEITGLMIYQEQAII